MFHKWVYWQVFAGKHLTDLTLDVMVQCHTLWLEEKGLMKPFKFTPLKETKP